MSEVTRKGFVDKDGNKVLLTIEMDGEPTASSTKPVTSGGVHTALAGKANLSHTHGINAVNGLDEALSRLAARILALEEESETVTWTTVDEVDIDSYKYGSTGNDVYVLSNLPNYAQYAIGDSIKIVSGTTEYTGAVMNKMTGPNRVVFDIDCSGIHGTVQIKKATIAAASSSTSES